MGAYTPLPSTARHWDRESLQAPQVGVPDRPGLSGWQSGQAVAKLPPSLPFLAVAGVGLTCF